MIFLSLKTRHTKLFFSFHTEEPKRKLVIFWILFEKFKIHDLTLLLAPQSLNNRTVLFAESMVSIYGCSDQTEYLHLRNA